MEMKVPERLEQLRVILSPSIAHASKVVNTPRAAFAIKVACCFFVLLITFRLFSIDSTIVQHDYKGTFTKVVKGNKAVFIQKALSNDIDGPFNNSTIVQLCEKQKWIPGLIFKCERPEGGVANVRNVFLNCLRYTIEAGGTGFVIPEMLALTSSTRSGPVPFTHFFDLDHFKTSLNTACPQIRIYNHINDLYDVPSTGNPIKLFPASLNHTVLMPDNHVIAAHSFGNWSTNFRLFLDQAHPLPITPERPIMVAVQRPLLEFPLAYDERRFVPQFGKLLRFREDTRRLAATVLYALSQKHELGLFEGNNKSIFPRKYYGAHLRTGPDATAAGWTPYSIQSQNYISEATKYSLELMYVASGNTADLARLAAINSSIIVETKESLLGEPVSPGSYEIARPRKGFKSEWAALMALNWDQRMLVDYEVLLRASMFGGIWESSFAWNVAMRRHVLTGGGGGAWRVIGKKRDEQRALGGRGRRRSRALSGLGERQEEPVVILTKESFVTEEASSAWQNDPSSKLPTRRTKEGAPDPFEWDTPPTTHPDAIAEPANHILPTPKDMIEEAEIDAEYIKDEEQLGESETTTYAAGKALKAGEKTFTDTYSSVFGPVGAGRRVVGSMWP